MSILLLKEQIGRRVLWNAREAGSYASSLIPLLGPLCGRGGREGTEWAFDRVEAAVAF